MKQADPRRMRRMSITTAVAAALGAALVPALLGGCGGAEAPPPAAPHVDEAPPDRAPPPPPDQARDEDDEDDELVVSSSRGSVDPAVVSERLAPRTAAIEACYATRVGRRKWLGGGLELMWDVRADGTIAAVRVASSDLGAWPIEKCVLAIARDVSFGKPRGNKPARVSAPVSFSAGSGAIAWDDASAAKAVGGRLTKLASCGPGGAGGAQPTDVTITLYLGTRGRVETVGFASPRGFSEAWADCAERAILGWSLTDPRGKVAKLSVTYNPSPDGGAGGAGGSTDDDEEDL